MEDSYYGKKDILIVGASGFGREVIRLIENINEKTPIWNVMGFLDDNPNTLDGVECGYDVVGSIKNWNPKPHEWFACALAFPEVKKKVVCSLKERGAKFATLIHPSAVINPRSFIDEGTIITNNCSISDNARVGSFCTILGSGVAHDVSVGDYSTLSGRCQLNGHVQCGKMVYMGCGVLVAPSKKIGDGATVGIGSVVISNVKAGTTVFGNPAKKMDF